MLKALFGLLAIAWFSANLAFGQQEPSPVMVVFTAQWCPYCQAMSPALEKLRRDGYDVRKVDVDSPQVTGTNYSGRQMLALYGVEFVPAVFVVDVDLKRAGNRPRVVKLGNPRPTEKELLGFAVSNGMRPQKKPEPKPKDDNNVYPNEGSLKAPFDEPVPPAPKVPKPPRPGPSGSRPE